MYYSSDQLLSRQSPVNMIMGERGNGKSFDAKKRMIKNFLKDGSQSMLIRRRQTDTDEIKNFFFNDIAEFFPNHEFEVKGYIGYIDGEEAIHFMALSTSIKKKSIPFPKVNLIVFDEYIEPSFKRPSYLKEEMFILLELINTVVRTRDNWRLIVIGNSISYVNPLFTFYGIEIKDHEQRFHSFLKDEEKGNYLITVELTETPEFREVYKQTNLAKLIQGTQYGEYAMSANAFEDKTDFIKPERSGNYIFIASLLANDIEVGVWLDEDVNFRIDEIIEKNSDCKFAIKDSDFREGYQSVKNNLKNWRLKNLKTAYFEGKVYYSSQTVKKFFTTECIRYF